MRRLLLLLIASLAACVSAPSAERPPVRPLVEVAVLRSAGDWTADFAMAERAPAWFFLHSALARVGEKPWRPGSWTVETEGVRLERRGWYDVLVADEGDVPARVRFRFTPFSGDLLADYDPALVFTDGSVALFSDQFDLSPLKSAGAADSLPFDLNDVKIEGGTTRIRFRDEGGRVLHHGRRVRTATTINGDTYVLFGPADPVVTPHIAAVIDPRLPQWIAGQLSRATPEILELYAETLGPRAGPKPTVMVSWAGPTKGLTSMGGSVLPGLVTMTFEGEGVLAENKALRDQASWFIAHEAAHFWLGQTVMYEQSRDSWITEGGADLLAARAIARADPAYDPKAFLQGLVAECAKLAVKPISLAGERNEQRAFYACGAVFGLVAEAEAGGDFFAFTRALIDANRADGFLTRSEWLAELTARSGDPTLAADIERMLDSGSQRPGADIASLFDRAGIAYAAGPDGVPMLR